MASNAQVKMLVARSLAAKLDYDWKALKDLDNDGVDKKLQEIEAAGSKKQTVTEVKTIVTKPEINGQRFGMCVKLVADNTNISYVIENPDAFGRKVQELYKIVTEIEEGLQSSSSQV